jgi:hypothetical protein
MPAAKAPEPLSEFYEPLHNAGGIDTVVNNLYTLLDDSKHKNGSKSEYNGIWTDLYNSTVGDLQKTHKKLTKKNARAADDPLLGYAQIEGTDEGTKQEHKEIAAHQTVLNWIFYGMAKRFGVDEAKKTMGEYKAAMKKGVHNAGREKVNNFAKLYMGGQTVQSIVSSVAASEDLVGDIKEGALKEFFDTYTRNLTDYGHLVNEHSEYINSNDVAHYKPMKKAVITALKNRGINADIDEGTSFKKLHDTFIQAASNKEFKVTGKHKFIKVKKK